jgi:hypothetical protein
VGFSVTTLGTEDKGRSAGDRARAIGPFLGKEGRGIWTDSPLLTAHMGGFPHEAIRGLLPEKGGGGAGLAKTADVCSGLLHRCCAIEAKQPQNWFPAAQGCGLTRESSPEHGLEARKAEAPGRPPLPS